MNKKIYLISTVILTLLFFVLAQERINEKITGMQINYYKGDYTGKYKIERIDGNESLYNISFIQTEINNQSYYKICMEASSPVIEVKDTIIPEDRELGTNEEVVKGYNYTIPDKINYEKGVNSLLSFKQSDLTQEIVKADTKSPISAYEKGDILRFCTEPLNPYVDKYIKIGTSSLVVVSETTVFNESKFTNVTVEENFSHLDMDLNSAPMNSLVAYWNFDVNNDSLKKTYDYSPYNNDGVITGENNLTWSPNALYGGVYNFSGKLNYINSTFKEKIIINGTENLSNGFSVSVWVNTRSSVQQSILSLKNSSGQNALSFELFRTSQKVRFTLVSTDGKTIFDRDSDTANLVTLNAWHHVLITGNNTRCRIYIDNVRNADFANQTANLLINWSSFNIGSIISSRFFNGSIDEIMIFNTTLNDAQVDSIYKNQTNRFKNPGTQVIRQQNISLGANSINASVTNYLRSQNSNISLRFGQWRNISGYKNYDFGVNTYADFDGINDRVNSSIIRINNNITITFWIYPKGYSNYNRIIRDDAIDIYLSDSINDLKFLVWNSTGGVDGFTNPVIIGCIVPNQWNFISLVVNDTKFVPYCNGVNNGTIYNWAGGDFMARTKTLSIGSAISDANFFNGSIDEVRIYNKTLTSAEILEINQSGRVANSSITSDKLVLWYKFDEDAELNDNKIVIDSSTSNNHGTKLKELSYNSDTLRGLVAYYHFDENSYSGTEGEVKDAIGLNNGTAMNGETTSSDGVYSRSAFFDGKNDGINFTTSTGLDALTNNLTISLWLRGNTSALQWIISKRAGGNAIEGGYSITISSGKLRVYFGNGTNGTDWSSINSNALDNNWHNLIYMNNRTDLSLYLDNVNIGTQRSVITGSSSSIYPLFIGSFRTGIQNFSGNLDEVMIFNRTLSQTEITELYVKGRARWNYTNYQNLTSANTGDTQSNNIYVVSNLTSNILPDFQLISNPYNFYTPILGNNFNLSFFDDISPPVITITYPTDYQSFDYDNNININFTRSDDLVGISSCWWSNSSGLYNTTLTNPLEDNISVSEGGDGTYSVTIWCNDAINNIGSSTIHYVINTVNPSVNLRTPTNNQWLNYKNNIEFNFTVSDVHEISECQLWGNWSGSWEKNQTNSSFVSNNSVVTNFSRINLEDGNYIWNVWCNETRGMANWNAINWTVSVDTVYPNVNLTNPLNISYTSNQMILNYTRSDINIDDCWYHINNSENVTLSSCNNISFTSNQGSSILYLYVNDSANNINVTNVTFFVDSIIPSVKIGTSFLNGSYLNYNTSIELNLTISDTNLKYCWYNIDLGANTTFTCGNNLSLNLSEAFHTLRIYANDSLNNVNYSEKISFTPDVTFPIINISGLIVPVNSPTITFNINITDTNLNTSSCKYSVFNSTSGIDGINNNVSITCSSVDNPATVSSYGTYNLTVYAKDYAGNENSSVESFTTYVETGTGGGLTPKTITKKDAIALISPISAPEKSNISRAVLYARIREFCTNYSLYPDDCTLDEEKTEELINILNSQETTLKSTEIKLWIDNYKQNMVEVVSVDESYIAGYNLFTGLLEINSPGFIITPKLIDSYFLILSDDYKWVYNVQSNKILKSCEIIGNNIDFNCTVSNGTGTIEYNVPEDYKNKIFSVASVKVNYISIDNNVAFQDVNLRIINLRNPLFIISALFATLFVIIIIKNKKRFKIKNLIKSK